LGARRRGFQLPNYRAMSIANGNVAGPAETGLLLVGHGSPEQPAADEFLAAGGLVAEMAGGWPVETCFLEFCQPTIDVGFRALTARGVRRVGVVPALLFAAGHAKRDIPAAVAAVAAEFPEIRVVQCHHLGCHEALVALARLRFHEALARQGNAPPDETGLVMVGRGSHDSEASAEMRRFVDLCAADLGVKRAAACFVAMARPRLTALLEEATTWSARQIVVVPHLLFGGVLVERIGRTVEAFAGGHPQIDWLLARHLGPTRLVANALLCRANEALSRL